MITWIWGNLDYESTDAIIWTNDKLTCVPNIFFSNVIHSLSRGNKECHSSKLAYTINIINYHFYKGYH